MQSKIYITIERHKDKKKIRTKDANKNKSQDFQSYPSAKVSINQTMNKKNLQE